MINFCPNRTHHFHTLEAFSALVQYAQNVDGSLDHDDPLFPRARLARPTLPLGGYGLLRQSPFRIKPRTNRG